MTPDITIPSPMTTSTIIHSPNDPGDLTGHSAPGASVGAATAAATGPAAGATSQPTIAPVVPLRPGIIGTVADSPVLPQAPPTQWPMQPATPTDLGQQHWMAQAASHGWAPRFDISPWPMTQQQSAGAMPMPAVVPQPTMPARQGESWPPQTMPRQDWPIAVPPPTFSPWPGQTWPAQAWPTQAWPTQAWPGQTWPAQAWPAQAWPQHTDVAVPVSQTAPIPAHLSAPHPLPQTMATGPRQQPVTTSHPMAMPPHPLPQPAQQWNPQLLGSTPQRPPVAQTAPLPPMATLPLIFPVPLVIPICLVIQVPTPMPGVPMPGMVAPGMPVTGPPVSGMPMQALPMQGMQGMPMPIQGMPMQAPMPTASHQPALVWQTLRGFA